MWRNRLLTIIYVGVVVAQEISNNSDNCSSVKTKRVSFKTVLECSPYFTQEASSRTVLGIDVTTIDSICFRLTDSDCGSFTADMQAIATLTDYSTAIFTGSLTEMNCGDFFVNATTCWYEDHLLGKPCSGTFVIYRCFMGGSCSSDDNGVLIVSEKRWVDDDCLEKAEQLASKTFPNIQFTKLPKTVENPCDFCG